MKDIIKASDKLMEHVAYALEHSMDLKKDGVDPMMPFAIAVTGETKNIIVFGGDTTEFSDAQFNKIMEDGNYDFVIYAKDTYLTTEDNKFVLLKAYDKKDAEIYVFCQKYIPQTEETEFKQVNNPAFIGTELNKYFFTNEIDGKFPGQSQKKWWEFWK